MSQKEIDEAIKNLQEMLDVPQGNTHCDSVRLGVEALERIKRDRDRDAAIGFIPDKIELLPSETEEIKE